jgi:alpha-L-fucosidase 2
VASIDIPLQVTLFPALPAHWGTRSIKGARICSGITLEFTWSDGKLTFAVFSVDGNVAGREREVIVNHAGEVVGRFMSNGGMVVILG